MLAQTWLAEAAAHRHGLKEALLHSQRTAKTAVVHIDATDGSEDVAEAVRATAAETEEDIRDMEEDEAMTRQALDLLSSRDNDPYEAALETLREDTRGWWVDTLARGPDELDEGEEAATADAAGLRRFLEGNVLPWFEARRKELANRR
jgi:acyl-CoA synthetase (NDP forming)